MELARMGGGRTLARTYSTAPSFVMAVGGVAFHNKAVSADGDTIVGLAYDATRDDGSRLSVTLKKPDGATRTCRAAIYDWELVPIAKYVAVEGSDACFTLFGELENESEQNALREDGARVLNYHEAFEDTLMGLRLFQSDILILSSVATDLPREAGKYVLGRGESAPDVEANTKAFTAVRTFLDDTDITWSSYVVSDEDQEVAFTAKDNQLELSGEPVWWCWEHNPEYREASVRASEKLQVSFLRRGIIRSGVRTAAQLAKISDEKLFTELMLEDETVLSRVMETTEKIVDDLSEEDVRNLYEKLLAAEVGSGENKISETIARETITKSLSEKIKEHRGINPAVYDAVKKTMRFSALFRTARSDAPDKFNDFIASVQNVQPEPQVETPNVIRIPEEQIDLDDLETLMRLLESQDGPESP